MRLVWIADTHRASLRRVGQTTSVARRVVPLTLTRACRRSTTRSRRPPAAAWSDWWMISRPPDQPELRRALPVLDKALQQSQPRPALPRIALGGGGAIDAID